MTVVSKEFINDLSAERDRLVEEIEKNKVLIHAIDTVLNQLQASHIPGKDRIVALKTKQEIRVYPPGAKGFKYQSYRHFDTVDAAKGYLNRKGVPDPQVLYFGEYR